MNVTYIDAGGDSDLGDVTKFTELDPGLFKFFVDYGDPRAVEDGAITTITAADTPFSFTIVDENGSGVCENVVRVEQLMDAPNDFEVTYDDDETETYTNAAITDALDQPTFDDSAFADSEPLWEPYDKCPFCRGEMFDERAVYSGIVDTASDPPGMSLDSMSKDERLTVHCRGCGETLLD